MYEICSYSTTKTPERRRSGVFIVNFEHISYMVPIKSNYRLGLAFVDFEQIILVT